MAENQFRKESILENGPEIEVFRFFIQNKEYQFEILFCRKSARKLSNNSARSARSPSPSRNRSPIGDYSNSSLYEQKIREGFI